MLVTEILSTGLLSKNWTCTKLLTALASCVMGCFALPSQIEPLKHLEGKWNKKALAGELSWTRSVSRARSNDCSGFSFQQRVLFSFCSAFCKRIRAGKIAFLFSLTPRGLIVSCEIQTFGFTVHIHYHFMKMEMQAPVVPLGDRSSRVEGREGWSWDTEELGREEMLLSVLKTYQSVVQNLLSGYCPVSLLPSLPHPFHAQA